METQFQIIIFFPTLQVEMYKKIEEPVLPKFGYYLPNEFGTKWFGAEYVSATKKWYIPSDGVPAFYESIYSGLILKKSLLDGFCFYLPVLGKLNITSS